MDWLTADLVFKAIWAAFLIMGLAYLCGSLVWLLCYDEASEDRARIGIWWRTRMLLLRNLIQRMKEQLIKWTSKEGDHAKQMERFRHAEVIANGRDGHTERQPYRGEPLNSSTADASDQRRDSRLLTGSFGG